MGALRQSTFPLLVLLALLPGIFAGCGQTTKMDQGYVCAAEDDDIHQVANMQDPGKDLITLHIYSLPIKNMTTYEFASRISPEAASAYKQPVGVTAGV